MNTSLRNPRPSDPAPSFTNGPAQLAAILAETLQENENSKQELAETLRGNENLKRELAETLQENENLKRELAIARRSVEEHEHMAGLAQKSLQNSTSPPSPEAPSQSAMNRLIDCQNELERMKIERDEAQASVKLLQELWNQLHRSYLDHCDFRIKDAPEGFNKRIADAEGKLVEITPEKTLHLPEIAGPFPPPAHLPQDGRSPILQTPTALVHPPSSIPSPVTSSSVPQPGTRVRPRAGSLDGPSHSTGGLPPAKKLRVDETSLAESGKCGGSVRFPFIFECFPFLNHSKAQNHPCSSTPTSVKATSNRCISRTDAPAPRSHRTSSQSERS